MRTYDNAVNLRMRMQIDERDSFRDIDESLSVPSKPTKSHCG